MTAKQIIFLLAIIVTGSAIGCSKESGRPGGNQNPPPSTTSCDGVNAKFSTDVFPLIQARCATGIGCHGAGSFNGPGALTSFDQIKNAANNIKNAVESGRMPKGSSLTAAQIRQISCWVDNGGLAN